MWTAVGGWDAAIALAEKLRASVYGAPLLDRASFPEDHPLFCGPLGMSVKNHQRPAGRARPGRRDRRGSVSGTTPMFPAITSRAGTELLQITADPEVAAGRTGG